MSDLVKRLRELAQAKHDDLSIGDEAADRIAELEERMRRIQTWHPTIAQAARIAELEDALRKAKAHFLDNNPIKAFVEVCTALAFIDQINSTALGEEK